MVAGYNLKLFNREEMLTDVVLVNVTTLMNIKIKRILYLGFEGKYELGPMRHFSCNVVAVKILTLPSSKAA